MKKQGNLRADSRRGLDSSGKCRIPKSDATQMDYLTFIVAFLLGFELFRHKPSHTPRARCGLGSLSAIGITVAMVMAGEVIPESPLPATWSVFGVSPARQLAFAAVVIGMVAASSGIIFSWKMALPSKDTEKMK